MNMLNNLKLTIFFNESINQNLKKDIYFNIDS